MRSGTDETVPQNRQPFFASGQCTFVVDSAVDHPAAPGVNFGRNNIVLGKLLRKNDVRSWQAIKKLPCAVTARHSLFSFSTTIPRRMLVALE